MVVVIDGVAVEVAVDCGGAGGAGRGAEVAEVAEAHGVHVEVAGGGDGNHHFHVLVSLLVHLFLLPYLFNHQYMWYEVATDVCFCEVCGKVGFLGRGGREEGRLRMVIYEKGGEEAGMGEGGEKEQGKID